MRETWNIRFGTAGTSDSFAAKGYKNSLDIPAYIAKMGLNAFEYQCGRGVRLGLDKAARMAALAAQRDILFSVHAPYYISMSSLEEDKRLNSIQYLLQSAAVCRALGGRRIIFHSGSCGKQSREAALEKALPGLLAGQCDVASRASCEVAFRAAEQALGRVDVLVNNAGITRDNLILRLTEQDFDAVLDTNLKSAFLCCKEAARRMVRQRYGRIVNLSSVVALRGNAGQTNYAASKAGLIGLTKSLARELAARNVTVNAVAPGFIDTDMTAVLPEAVRTGMTQGIPAGRAGQPEDVAQAVAFFAAEQSSYLTGQVLCVDGGMAM